MIAKVTLIFITLFSLDNLIGIFLPRTLFGVYVMVPYTLLIAVCLYAFYDDDGHLPLLAFAFGFIVDTYHANLIGLYAVLFPLMVLLIKKYIVPVTPLNFVSIFYMSVSAIMVTEILVFALVRLVTSETMTLLRFVQHRLIITLVFNVLLLALIYWPLVKLFQPKDDKKRKIKTVMTDNTKA